MANGGYQLIYTFNRNIDQNFPGTAVPTQGSAHVDSTVAGPGPNQVTVNLSSVATGQHVFINLSGVHDTIGTVMNNLPARMDVLVGDATGNGRVDGNDVSGVQGQVRAPVTSSNFRYDVTGNGRIDGNDVSTTQSYVRTRLP
jgi:hypothetical protein